MKRRTLPRLMIVLVMSLLAVVCAGANEQTFNSFPASRGNVSATGGNQEQHVAHDYMHNRILSVYLNVDESRIYGQFLKPDGSNDGSAFRITDSTDEESWPDVVFDPVSGKYLIAWISYDTSNYYVKGRLINADGTKSGGVIDISTSGDFKYYLSCVFDSVNGRFIIGWIDSRNSSYNVYGQIVNSDGTLYGTAANVNFPIVTGKTIILGVSFAFDSHNARFLTSFVDNSNDIGGQIMNADGTPYGTAVDTNFKITDNSASQFVPTVTFDSDNNRYLAAWVDVRNDDGDIYGQFVNPDGSLYGTASDVNFIISNRPLRQNVPVIIYSSKEKRYLTLFRDQGVTALYGQFTGPDGSPLGTATDANFLVSSMYPNTINVFYNIINENYFIVYDSNDPGQFEIFTASVGTFHNSAGTPSPDSLAFGSISVGGSSDPQTATLTSSGTGNLYVNNAAITGTDASDFTLQNDNLTGNLIGSGDSGTIQVVFSPASDTSYGEKTATLVISSTDADTPDREIPLTGTAVTGTPPPAPELISPANGQTTNSNDVEFTWKEVVESIKGKGAVAKYKLYVSDNSDFTGADVYEVSSDTSNKLKATGISVVFLGVVLGAWRRRRDGVKYLVVLILLGSLFLGIGFTGCGGGSGSTTTTSTTETISYKVYDLNYGQTYYWKVEAIGSSGLSTSSEVRTFTTPAYGL